MLFSYKDNYIYIIMDSEQELKQVTDILNQHDFFLHNRATMMNDKTFRIHEKYMGTLNKIMLPCKKSIRTDSAFSTYVEKFKAQMVKHKGVQVSGLIINKLPHRCFMIGSRNLIPMQDIVKACRYFTQAALGSKKYKDGQWDGYIHLFRKRDMSFPTGLLSKVEEILQKHKVPYQISVQYEEHPPRQFDWEVHDDITPEPDQVEAINAGLKGKRGIMKAPTGFGKTAVLAKYFVAGFGVPSLFVANKKTLLDDASQEFIKGIQGLDNVGQIKDGMWDTYKLNKLDKSQPFPAITSPVIVATIQSLIARLSDPMSAPALKDWLQNTCQFIMIDECQAVGTAMWDTLLDTCNAPYRIFLSATPWRTDGATLKLIAGSGPVLYTTTAEEQIEKDRLCELEIYFHKFDHQLYNDNDNGIPYSEAYAAFIAGNEERNKLIVKLAAQLVAEERLTLVFVTNIDHGHLLRSMFLEYGFAPDDIRFIFGGTSNKERRQGIQDFREGKFKILIGSTIFDAGANIPAISGAVVAGAGNADLTIIQKIGRAARNCDYEKVLGYTPKFMQGKSKKCSVIYDILDTNVCYFRKQSRNRYYTSRKEYGLSRVHLADGAVPADLRPPKKKAIEQELQVMDETGFLNEFRDFQNTLDN